MKTFNKKTYFLFVFEKGGIGVLGLLEDILTNNENNYVHLLYNPISSNDLLVNRIESLRSIFYNRVITKKVTNKPKNTIKSFFTGNNNKINANILKDSIRQFVSDYKYYSENEEYLIVACQRTSIFIDNILRNMDIDNSKIHRIKIKSQQYKNSKINNLSYNS